MEWGLYRHILKELKATRALKVLCIMFQNEPLLDPELARRIQVAREILGGRILLKTVTNGTLLDQKRSRELISAGINQIAVSIDAATEETYRKIRPGLSFSRVVENLTCLLEEDHHIDIEARFVRQKENEGEEEMFRRYWTSRGAQVNSFSVVNRAGRLRDYQNMKDSSPGLFRRSLLRTWNIFFPQCALPFFSLNILLDGRVPLCCHDWFGAETMGDLSSQNLSDVWNGEKMNLHRYLLRKKQSPESAICRGCSVVAKPESR
jgi:MoaA/NifB/PqqE/SkfB family radical SAM enzyme